MHFLPAATVRPALARLHAWRKAAEHNVVGRKDILDQIVLALLTNSHVLLEGPPGTAKSYLADTLFSALDGAEYFKVQCTAKMSEDYLVGPLDMHLFREEGTFVHRVEGYLPTAHFAFLDEFLDLSSGAQRALLGILNERTFVRGPQRVRCPLRTAIACTNFSFSDRGSDEAKQLAAVADRFLFRAKVEPLNRADRQLMFRDRVPMPTLSLADVDLLASHVRRVAVPQHVLAVYLDLCQHLTLTDRTCRRGLAVVKAHAVWKGRAVAEAADVMAMIHAFAIPGDQASQAAFSKAARDLSPAIRQAELRPQIIAVTRRLSAICTALRDAPSYKIGHAWAIELREAEGAVNHLAASVSGTPHAPLIDTARAKLAEGINLADTLYLKDAP